jgi:hypothetical protein
MEIIEGRSQILYTRVGYSLATEEAERIGVDHIARSSVTGTSHTSAGKLLEMCSRGTAYLGR